MADAGPLLGEGLTAERAAELLEEAGPNRLPRITPVPMWLQFIGQFFHFFALMLWVAALLALLAGMPQLAVAIVLVVIVNGLFAFLQEYRAERSAAKLRDLLPVRATVVRDGVQVVMDAAQIVPGDTVLLREGDRVCADMRCGDARGLLIDASMLTGESVPDDAHPDDTLYAGTFVVQGEGSAVVTATAGRTRFAQIARLTQAQPRPRTPLELDIRKLARTIAVIAASVGVVFFVLMLVLGVPAEQGFIFGIGVTVALVPEGLLPTVTLSLAIGAQRMAGQRALVRRLESVETLGATTVICSDKTGTITQNRMNVVEVWTTQGSATIVGEGYSPDAHVDCPHSALQAVHEVARVARMTSRGDIVERGDGWEPRGDPMDAAIDALVRRLGEPEPSADDEMAFEPFDPVRRMAVSRRADAVMCKGAPEAVIEQCDQVPDDVHAVLQEFARRGLRVLAVARDTRLLGLLAFEDPPREGVTEAVAQCRRAGIRLVMITGDHPRTAHAIASERARAA